MEATFCLWAPLSCPGNSLAFLACKWDGPPQRGGAGCLSTAQPILPFTHLLHHPPVVPPSQLWPLVEDHPRGEGRGAFWSGGTTREDLHLEARVKWAPWWLLRRWLCPGEAERYSGSSRGSVPQETRRRKEYQCWKRARAGERSAISKDVFTRNICS